MKKSNVESKRHASRDWPTRARTRTDLSEALERIAAILRNEGVISTGAAAEISGMTLQDFIERYGMRLEP